MAEVEAVAEEQTEPADEEKKPRTKARATTKKATAAKTTQAKAATEKKTTRSRAKPKADPVADAGTPAQENEEQIE